MHRHFPDTDYIKKVLQTIWHQVNNAQEIYVVGKILDDDTVMGGTGWGAEFAKLCNKPLFVFDQDRDALVALDRHGVGSATPAITAPALRRHRHALPARQRPPAIDELFARSFK